MRYCHLYITKCPKIVTDEVSISVGRSSIQSTSLKTWLSTINIFASHSSSVIPFTSDSVRFSYPSSMCHPLRLL
ncbi:unnamed protein product [Allacma fusca]|uniref:Uncharacterized protein n=1 Tax=Allacma fusca TaxID=39272 RepID=A0A8J2L1J4_9HEXA|nr:unnamed protein product [Allacma fusca]